MKILFGVLLSLGLLLAMCCAQEEPEEEEEYEEENVPEEAYQTTSKPLIQRFCSDGKRASFILVSDVPGEEGLAKKLPGCVCPPERPFCSVDFDRFIADKKRLGLRDTYDDMWSHCRVLRSVPEAQAMYRSLNNVTSTENFVSGYLRTCEYCLCSFNQLAKEETEEFSANARHLAHEANSKTFIEKPVHPRMLPKIFVLGCQKCGTTTLHKVLKGHPDLESGIRLAGEPVHYNKEIHYFEAFERYSMGLKFYTAHFSVETSVKPPHPPKIRLDGTPKYLCAPRAAQRIHETYSAFGLANALKFLIILRDPIDRAFSYFNVLDGLSNQSLAFEDMVSQIGRNQSKMATYSHRNVSDYCGMFPRGLYAAQISSYLTYFSPNQFMILDSRGDLEDQDQLKEKLSRFLDIPPFPETKKKSVRANAHPPRKVMSAESRAILERYYYESNKELYLLLKKVFNIDWKPWIYPTMEGISRPSS